MKARQQQPQPICEFLALAMSLFQPGVLQGVQLTCMGFKLGQGTARAKAQDGFSALGW